MTVRPAEAAIVRECARRFLAGESIRSICADLNARGVSARSRGGAWSPQTLRRMLGSGRISGQREHKGEIVATAEWPAIIEPAETAQIRARLADPDAADQQDSAPLPTRGPVEVQSVRGAAGRATP